MTVFRRRIAVAAPLAIVLLVGCGDGPVETMGDRCPDLPLSLLPGEWKSAELRCPVPLMLEGAGAVYRVGVRWDGPIADDGIAAQRAVTLVMSGHPAPDEAPPSLPAAVSPEGPEPIRPWAEGRNDTDAWSGTEAGHLRIREGEIRLLREGSALRSLPSLPTARGADPAPPTGIPPGPLSYIPYRPRGCLRPEARRTAYPIASSSSLLLHAEDPGVLSPTAAAILLDYYERFGAPIVESYFGPVPDVDGNGGVHVVITADMAPDIAGFVWSGNFLARTGCAASNEMEILFLNEALARSFARGGDPQILSTLVHEMKHIVSLHQRLRHAESRGLGSQGRPTGFHEPWFEEGSAEVAAELASRLAWESEGGPPLGTPVLRSDLARWGTRRSNAGVVHRLRRAAEALRSEPNSMVGNPPSAPRGHSYYGSAWHFLRFVGDAFGRGPHPFHDRDLFRWMHDSLRVPAPSSFPETPYLGVSAEHLLDAYGASLLLLDLQGTGELAPTFRSYDFPEVLTPFSPSGSSRFPWSTMGMRVPDPPDASGETRWNGWVGSKGLWVVEIRGEGAGGRIDLMLGSGSEPLPGRFLIARVR